MVNRGGIYCVGSASFNVNGNWIEGATQRAISIDPNTASDGSYQIIDNTIEAESGTTITDLYYVYLAAENGHFVVRNNSINCENATSYDAGYQLHIGSDVWRGVCADNIFKASASQSATDDLRAVRIQAASGRTDGFVIKNNSFKNFKYGYFLSDTGGTDVSLFEGGAFDNVQRETWSSQRDNILSGRWLANQNQASASLGTTIAEIFTDATPSNGTWQKGDRIWNTDTTDGSVLLWVYDGSAWQATGTVGANNPS